MRLLDSGLGDIKNKLKGVAKTLESKYKKDPTKVPLNVIVKRGDIDMAKGEWLKNPSLASKLTMNTAELQNIFSEKNLNMGILGYGSTKEGLGNLIKWVKHNINPAKIKGDARDLKIEIDKINYDPKKPKKGVTLILRVPEKGAETSKDLTNVKLEKLGYIGLKKWTEEELKNIESSNDKLDKVLVAVLTGKANLKTKVKEVLK